MKHFKTLIVDDEKLARDRLRRMLVVFDDQIDIIAEAASGTEALHQIAEHNPDLVFLDIQMPEKNGFEVLQTLKSPPAIIFVTAYDEYALRAFDANAIDYLLKPVKQERLAQAIQKLPQSSAEAASLPIENLLKYIQNPPSALQRLTIKKGDRIQFVAAESVIYFKAEDKYTFAVLENREEIVDFTLNELEEMLDAEKFRRIHRRYIINLAFLKELRRQENSRYTAVLKAVSQPELTISRGYLSNILPK